MACARRRATAGDRREADSRPRIPGAPAEAAFYATPPAPASAPHRIRPVVRESDEVHERVLVGKDEMLGTFVHLLATPYFTPRFREKMESPTIPGRSKLSTEEALLRGGVGGSNENWRSVMYENGRRYRRFGCARLVA